MLEVDPDAGQRASVRAFVCGLVVDSHERDVPGNVEAGRAAGAQDGGGRVVVDREDPAGARQRGNPPGEPAYARTDGFPAPRREDMASRTLRGGDRAKGPRPGTRPRRRNLALDHGDRSRAPSSEFAHRGTGDGLVVDGNAATPPRARIGRGVQIDGRHRPEKPVREAIPAPAALDDAADGPESSEKPRNPPGALLRSGRGHGVPTARRGIAPDARELLLLNEAGIRNAKIEDARRIAHAPSFSLAPIVKTRLAFLSVNMAVIRTFFSRKEKEIK